jgi:hypothetical protein
LANWQQERASRRNAFRFSSPKPTEEVSHSETENLNPELGLDLTIPPLTTNELSSPKGVVPAISIAGKLRAFRDSTIAAEVPDWEAHRSILRDSMIETLIAQRITDPNDWYSRVPLFQRSGTNPTEKHRYWDRICEILEEMLPVSG